MDKIKIILADDHKLVRDGIKSLLQMNPTFEVVAEVDNGLDLIHLMEKQLPDVVLVDISMPGSNGLEAVSKLLKINPNFKFIMLTMHDDPEYILKSVETGAKGYLLKNVEFEELQTAIITVASGGKYFNQQISERMIESLSRPRKHKDEIPDLTSRELEVLKEVANGLSTKLIADKLNISARTVETHRLHIMKKMFTQNTAELVKKAIELKMI
ncbi:MAG TPA: response regulator transcription factor [Cytophagaceae bacterium]